MAEGWIDAEPRPGKVGGAFCMPVRDGESRVLLSFDGSFDSVQTLAHELGHAYHNTQLGPRPWLQRQTPMALAETASIFCETVMVDAGLRAAGDDPGARLAILDADLVGAAQVVVDIHSRFLFETALSAERGRGAVGPARLTELMAEAQVAAYGDGVDPDHLHPHMWAVKGHYYTAFYNWPYTFGLLFGLGPLRRVPARPGALPGRLRRPAGGHRAGRRRAPRRPLRHRHPRPGLLGLQPGGRRGPHRRGRRPDGPRPRSARRPRARSPPPKWSALAVPGHRGS